MRLRVSGDCLVACDAQWVRVYELRDGALALRWERREESALNAFSPDPSGEQVSRVEGSLFARSFTAPGQPGHWAEQRSGVAVYDLALGERARFDAGLRLEDTALALSPDGLHVASVDRGAGVVVLDARSGERRWEHRGELGSGVSWSPDGRALAAGDSGQGGGELYLLELGADGVRRRALAAPPRRVPMGDAAFCSLFSADGARVYFASAAWGLHGVVAYEVATGEVCWSASFEGGGEDEEDDSGEPRALELALVSGGEVLLVGIAGGVRAFGASDGAGRATLPCAGASGPWFAPHEPSRALWFVRDGALASAPFPGDW
jgi:hypothetical protein